MKRNQFKKTVSMRSTSSAEDRPCKLVKTVSTETMKPIETPISKDDESNELEEEIEELLARLNLEKSETRKESPMVVEQTNRLENVAKTVYDYQKVQVTNDDRPREKKESPNLLERILVSRSAQIPKYSSFNPFPSRSFNENVAMNGVKLGLYAPDSSNR